MRRGIQLASCAAVALIGCAVFPVLGSDLSKFLHAVFEDQYGRPPTGAEVNYYSNVSRSDGPLESQIRMVASDGYYFVQCQQNPDVYVVRLYQIFLHREPRPEEHRYWVARMPRGTSDDRAAFVRQFCQANNLTYYVPSTPGTPLIPVHPGSTQSDIAETLVARAALLADMIRTEMGGTRFGQDLMSKAAVLVSASTQYRDTVNSQRSTPQQLSIAAANVERAAQELAAQFRTVPGASVTCQSVLWDVSQLVAAMQPPAGAGAPQPAPRNAVETEAAQLLAVLRQFAYVLAPDAQQGGFYANLYRDIGGLAVQAESLQELARAGAGQRDVQRVMTGILTQARSIGSQLTSADRRLQQSWWNVQHEVDQLAVAAGCGGDFYVSTDHPVILNSPGWVGFPVQPSPGYQSSSDTRAIVGSADQLLTLIDSYVQSLRPITGRNRDAARMVDQAFDMRHQVLILRQRAAMGQWGAPLQSASREVVRQYKDVASRTFLLLVGQDPTLNSPIWSQIGELAYTIDKAVGGSRY